MKDIIITEKVFNIYKQLKVKIPYYNQKKIWITGASSGIGRALAIELSKHGAYIILTARSIEKLKETQALLQDPSHSQIVSLDISQSEEIDTKTLQLLKQLGNIDILINNAGISQRSLTMDTSMDVYHKLMQINFFGVIRMSKLVLPNMIERVSGHIVTISSVNGKLGSYMKSGYAASKHALHGFFDSLRAEIDGSGVDITLVTPGYVQTPISINALTNDGTPLGTMDRNTDKGIPVDHFAKKLVKQIAKGKLEISIAGNIESLGLFLKRFWPNMLHKLAARRREA